mgnify:CR=1 FL=1|jgi:antitoxin component of MazEF toxin-antitoxin module
MGTKRAHGSKSEPVRKIGKTGTYTYYVTLPKSVVDDLSWRDGQKVVVKKSGTKIVIEDWKPPRKTRG